MSHTYLTSLVSDVHKVRFYIGDTNPEEGPRPNGETYTDEEISAVLTLEGSWQRGVAAMFETLAAEWRPFPSFDADQFSLSSSHISRGYRDEAESWRAKWGYGGTAVGVRSVSPIRVDAYSDDLTGDGSDAN